MSSKVTSNVSYTALSFNQSSLEADGLALLPIVAGSGVEGYRRPFGEAMNKTADSLITNFMPWNETLDSLNNHGLVSYYNSAIRSYQDTGIIDRSILQKMHQATDKNYFLFVHLAPPTAERYATYSSFSGVSVTETKSVSAFGIVWSSKDGDVVWEGYAVAEVTTGEFTYSNESDMERAVKVARALMTSLLR